MWYFHTGCFQQSRLWVCKINIFFFFSFFFVFVLDIFNTVDQVLFSIVLLFKTPLLFVPDWQKPHWVRGHCPHRSSSSQRTDRHEPDQNLQGWGHGVKVHRESSGKDQGWWLWRCCGRSVGEGPLPRTEYFHLWRRWPVGKGISGTLRGHRS